MAKKGCLKKIFNFVLFVAFIASIFIYPFWYEKQWHKVQGMYYVAVGDKYLRKTNFQKAIEQYKKGLSLYPEHYGAWFNLGNLYVVYEDYYSAIDAYDNAIKFNPNYVIARMNYGIIASEKLGDFDGAIQQYDKIIEIRRKPVYIPFVFNNLRSYKTNIGLAYYNKGVAYRQKSTYIDNDAVTKEMYLKKSIEAFKEAAKILKNDYDTRYNLALSYHLNGDYNLAGLTYCKAIELSPMSYEAHYNLAVLLNHLKYYQDALKVMHKANALLSEDGDTNQTRYVFEVMNDVTRKILKDDSGRKYLAEEFGKDEINATVAFTDDGKIKTSEEMDTTLYEQYKVCNARALFRDEDNLDEDEEAKNGGDKSLANL